VPFQLLHVKAERTVNHWGEKVAADRASHPKRWASSIEKLGGSSLVAQGRDTKEGQAVYWYFDCSLGKGESSRGRLLVP
jgi:hypothetical protein